MLIFSLLKYLIDLDSFREDKFSEDFKQSDWDSSLQVQVLVTEIEARPCLSHLCSFFYVSGRVLFIENLSDLIVNVDLLDGRDAKLGHLQRALAVTKHVDWSLTLSGVRSGLWSVNSSKILTFPCMRFNDVTLNSFV